MSACDHCKHCKDGCKDICKCCGICNTCGLQARPVVAAPAPVFVPYPVPSPMPVITPYPYPSWADRNPFWQVTEITCGPSVAGCATPFLGECQTVALTAEAQANNWLTAREIGASS